MYISGCNKLLLYNVKIDPEVDYRPVVWLSAFVDSRTLVGSLEVAMAHILYLLELQGIKALQVVSSSTAKPE